jgi:hypothetical protein
MAIVTLLPASRVIAVDWLSLPKLGFAHHDVRVTFLRVSGARRSDSPKAMYYLVSVTRCRVPRTS